jgi:hypothetical protein
MVLSLILPPRPAAAGATLPNLNRTGFLAAFTNKYAFPAKAGGPA